MVCALDNAQAGTISALATRDLAAAAVAESARKGYVDGQALAGVFTWLRPNDLVWSYVVNNYLLGKEPPAFDILYWNQDTVRMAAGLHRDFIHIALENSFTRPGALEVLGTPVDMSAVDLDVYAVAGLSDHIVPWENAYRSAQLFGGSPALRARPSGHIQALVNPPAREGAETRASYRVADDLPSDAEAFAAQTPDAPRKLVAGLGRVAGRALRRHAPGAAGPRQPALPRPGQGTGKLCPRELTLPPMPGDGRWWGRPLAETRWQLELARLMRRPGAAGSRRAPRRRPPGRADAGLRRRRSDPARARGMALAHRLPPVHLRVRRQRPVLGPRRRASRATAGGRCTGATGGAWR